MTPAFRRNGILAGLALSSLCALGFAQRSSKEWALRWQVESEVRESRETELEAAQRERGAEMDAMRRRVALLESELSREREIRELAEGRATAAALPAVEIEASKAELERAYVRIRELESGDSVRQLGMPGSRIQVRLAGGTNSGGLEVMTAIADLPQDDGSQIEFLELGEQKNESLEKIKCANELVQVALVRTECKFVEVTEPLPQKFEGGLNQGTDYVDPDEMTEGKTVQYKLEVIRQLIGELKEVQQEQK